MSIRFKTNENSIAYPFMLGCLLLLLFSLSVVSDSVTPWTEACQDSLSFTISQSLIKLMSIESVMPSNHLVFCHPLHLLPAICPSIRAFSNESALCIRRPKYWSFSFSISPSNHSGSVSLKIDWFDFLEVQGTLKSLLQHHSSKTSFIQCSAFFMFQLSHPHMTTGQKHSFHYINLCWKSNVSIF